MINCCKVITTFIGHRPFRSPVGSTVGKRRFGNHFQTHGNTAGVLEMLEEVYRLECELDPGIPMDTILVCNGRWPEEANKFIEMINESRTVRGTLRVVDRVNTGLSFGGYSHAFGLFKDKYKFWIFTEDDILYIKPDYAAASLEFMRKKKCHFVAPLRINDRHRRPHCYGGVGFTKRGVLDKVAAHFGGKLPYHDQKPRIQADGGFKHHLFVRHGEIALTTTIVELGMRLGELIGLTRFYYDWKELRARDG